jgi:hypothetical protein
MKAITFGNVCSTKHIEHPVERRCEAHPQAWEGDRVGGRERIPGTGGPPGVEAVEVVAMA